MKRDSLRPHLKSAGIEAEIYYPVPSPLQKCFNYLGYKSGDFPESEKASHEALALPIFPELSRQQSLHIAKKLRSFSIRTAVRSKK